MQTLGVSNTAPPAESRLKTLFWPSIRNEIDVDHVSRQGFWLCAIVAGLTILIGFANGPVIFALSVLDGLFYFFAGIGIRQRSRLAAGAAFVAYAASALIVPAGILSAPRFILLALLLANVRAISLSAAWQPGATEPPPLPPDETWTDKFSGAMPIRVWPVARWIFYVLTALEFSLLALVFIGQHANRG